MMISSLRNSQLGTDALQFLLRSLSISQWEVDTEAKLYMLIIAKLLR